MNMTFFFHEKNKINVSAFTFTITTIPSILTLQNKGGLHSMKCSSETLQNVLYSCKSN